MALEIASRRQDGRFYVFRRTEVCGRADKGPATIVARRKDLVRLHLSGNETADRVVGIRVVR
jgi:hypothetical protein